MKTKILHIIKSNKILGILALLVFIGVLVFDIFHLSASYGIVEINSINSLLLVPFIVLVCWFGILLGKSKLSDEFDMAYQGKISNREKEVIALIVTGKKNKEISDELFVDISTIKSHINNIYRKTGVKNRKELILVAKSVLEKD
ncbi:helix-turn-helix domain-containing protein [Aquimarina algiphila]|uniref:helix-turn-helix domain-containing protein n=1 Tax=Aquimarina algiphila TaxID=2047982 RepID=UPI00232F02B1|nr:helix-turn-helix transcriptional regulator [Aquimarina algiphila]